MTTRRDVLKLTLAASGAALAAPKSALGQLCLDDGLSPVIVPPSPTITPFVAPLFIPPIKKPRPLSDFSPAPNFDGKHQAWDRFPPQKFYIQTLDQFRWSYHPQLQNALHWGFDGITPGPTFHARYGEPVFVRRINQLPYPGQIPWAAPTATTHLHNFHSPSESDGFPLDFFEPGTFWDHHYPLYEAGGDPSERLTSLWYHDHMIDFTAPNVYAGWSGFWFNFDDYDTGNENDRGKAWRLPSGKYDIPFMLHDVVFEPNPNGGPNDVNVVFNPFMTDGWLGDVMTVNRTALPYLEVEPRKYRFRVQNGGPSRYYELFLSTGDKFTVITTDGNFLEEPLEKESINLAVAERHDVIVDFSRFRPGDTIVLENRLEQIEGRGPTGRLIEPGMSMMQFRVVPLTGPDNSQIPSKFRPQPKIDLSEVVRERTWVFDYDDRGLWTVNGELFNGQIPTAEVKQGTAEIWTIRNGGSNWSHPVHIHFEEFQILEWNGRPIPQTDVRSAKKDVINLGPNDEVKIFMRWRDFLGKYVMHCHNVVHEDHAMMIRWDIIP